MHICEKAYLIFDGSNYFYEDPKFYRKCRPYFIRFNNNNIMKCICLSTNPNFIKFVRE